LKRSLFARTGDRTTRQDGMAILAVLFAISAFSALAVTVLTDTTLEGALAAGAELTVSAPGQNASSLKAPWPLTITRARLGESEFQVRIPVPADFEPELPVGAGSNPGGWHSVVQVAPGIRVCCDGGDGLCRNRPLEETTDSTDPASDLSFSPGSPTQSLMFSLLTGADSQASGAANQSAVYTVNAKPQPPDAVSQEAISDGQTPGGGVVMCQLEKGEVVLAAGLIRLQQAPPPTGDGSDRVLEGTLRLDYFRPPGSK